MFRWGCASLTLSCYVTQKYFIDNNFLFMYRVIYFHIFLCLKFYFSSPFFPTDPLHVNFLLSHSSCYNYIYIRRPWWSWSNVLAIYPMFVSSNPAEVDRFFLDVKILNTSPRPQGGILSCESRDFRFDKNFKPEKKAPGQNMICLFKS